ncbi:branched-chain amino acid ABC transporter permease [Bradyrhizobium sp. CSA207]|uniref:branched-chain amino acid ABC transporter permease n=1 Tax=Bradyrhizobium sp. CSA207 TaxID=2698826 RepID=UPI0023AFF242|nr:branched-chain amino acid ABC transporter permease [Bradyrhizobium sp. CSA207]MDE5445784.1 branched-chain amino acid ABC transporter permease [Bradyrhizobium sp. CSA207]
MTTFFQLVVSGITVGSIYALVAIGFTLVYRASGIFNFAQGEYVMLGGMITGILMTTCGVGFVPASLVAILVTVAIGAISYLLAIRPARSAAQVHLLIITIGISVLLRGLTSALLGKDFVRIPTFVSPETFNIGGVVIQSQALLVIAGAMAMASLLWLFLTRSFVGKGITAVSANLMAAKLVGINPAAIVALCFGISACIGAVGGLVATPITMTSYDAGTMLAIKGFSAAMLGGISSAAGPLVGGLLIGLFEAFGAGYVSSTYKDAFALLILLGVLAFRPQGLFGNRSTQRV